MDAIAHEPSLLIRSSMCGRPDWFRSVRDRGRVPARCSSQSGIPQTRSPRWLPASDGLPPDSPVADRRVRAGRLPALAVVLVPRPSPIGLTAAGLFAAGEVSRADSRVRSPSTFTCARWPAETSALDALPEAYHNPAAVWWGALAASPVIREPAGHRRTGRCCPRSNTWCGLRLSARGVMRESGEEAEQAGP